MIDIDKAEKYFDEYISKYDKENIRVKRKIIHTYNVVALSKILCDKLNLSEEDKKLSMIIALLHDIGRFEQVKRYNTFSDRVSIDHAELGVQILFKEGLIRKFVDEDTYDSIIYKAIRNHNKYKIEDGLNERELMHSKIIRDIDKIDILAGASGDNRTFFNEEIARKQNITQEVFEDALNKRTVDRKNVKNDVDNIVTCVAMVFDLNYKESREIMREKGYALKIIDGLEGYTPDTIEKLKKIRNAIQENI